MKISEILLEKRSNREKRADRNNPTINDESGKKYNPNRKDQIFVYELFSKYDESSVELDYAYTEPKKQAGGFEDVVSYIMDEYNIEKDDTNYIKEGKYGIWYGVLYEDPDPSWSYNKKPTEHDEFGGMVKVFIVSNTKLSNKKLNKLTSKIENEIEGWKKDMVNDHFDDEYERNDPYGYRGLSKSDFY